MPRNPRSNRLSLKDSPISKIKLPREKKDKLIQFIQQHKKAGTLTESMMDLCMAAQLSDTYAFLSK